MCFVGGFVGGVAGGFGVFCVFSGSFGKFGFPAGLGFSWVGIIWVFLGFGFCLGILGCFWLCLGGFECFGM